MSTSPSDDTNRRRKKASQIAQAYRAAHEIISAAVSLGIMVFGGFWLDRKLGWSPVLTVSGALLGFVVAGVSLRALLRRLDQESAKKKKNSSEAPEANGE